MVSCKMYTMTSHTARDDVTSAICDDVTAAVGGRSQNDVVVHVVQLLCSRHTDKTVMLEGLQENTFLFFFFSPIYDICP